MDVEIACDVDFGRRGGEIFKKSGEVSQKGASDGGRWAVDSEKDERIGISGRF